MQYCVLACTILMMLSCAPAKSSVPNEQQHGDQIIAALEKYKAERGSYPDTLSELEPNYLGHITPPHYGEKKWDYVHYCKNDSFGLAMWGRRPTDDGYVYSSERKKWEITANSF